MFFTFQPNILAILSKEKEIISEAFRAQAVAPLVYDNSTNTVHLHDENDDEIEAFKRRTKWDS